MLKPVLPLLAEPKRVFKPRLHPLQLCLLRVRLVELVLAAKDCRVCQNVAHLFSFDRLDLLQPFYIWVGTPLFSLDPGPSPAFHLLGLFVTKLLEVLEFEFLDIFNIYLFVYDCPR
jgi:hypothetical protein